MKYFLIILLINSLMYGYKNPYTDLSLDQKLSIMINYFIYKEIQAQFPPKPIKEKIDDNKAIEIVKFERYYNYIQRLKYIKENRKKQRVKIEKKYKEDIEQYNQTITKLKNYYSNPVNYTEVLRKAINNSFKIFYGKLILQKPYKKNKKLYGQIVNIAIYKNSYNLTQNIQIVDIDPKKFNTMIEFYRAASVLVHFDYDFKTKILKYKNLTILLNNTKYKGIFQDDTIQYKLNITLDQSIFKLLTIKDDNVKDDNKQHTLK